MKCGKYSEIQVVADLTNVKTGISEVKLSINNLPSGLTATVNPDKITVKVGKRVSKTFHNRQLSQKVRLLKRFNFSVNFGDSRTPSLLMRTTWKN